jgi:hypothetical protein
MAQWGKFNNKKLTKRDHARILFEGTANNTQSGRQYSIKLAETLNHDDFGSRHTNAAWDAHYKMGDERIYVGADAESLEAEAEGGLGVADRCSGTRSKDSDLRRRRSRDNFYIVLVLCRQRNKMTYVS